MKASDFSDAGQEQMNQTRSGSSIESAAASESSLASSAVMPKWFVDQDLWIEDPSTPTNALYNYCLFLHLKGNVDVAALQWSLGEIIRRHEILRSKFLFLDGELVIKVAPHELPPITVRDLSDLPEGERDVRSRQLASEEARRAFDLREGPFLRSTLLRLTNGDHILLLTTHHLVYDDWSNGVLIRELSALYSAAVSGNPCPFSALPLQYNGFLHRTRERLYGKDRLARVKYLSQHLSGGNGFHHLAADHPRPMHRTYCGATESKHLSQDLLSSVQRLSQVERTSLFITLVAGFKSLLHLYSGETEIAIGSCAANRSMVECEGLIGRFGNDVVFRTDFSGNPSFHEILQRVREEALTAYSYQDLPFGELVNEIDPQDDPSRNRLFQVMFILQNAPKDKWSMPGVEVSSFPLDLGTAKYDLNVWLRIHNGLEVALEHNSDLFNSTTMKEILADFETILETMTRDAGVRISEVGLASARAQVLKVDVAPQQSLRDNNRKKDDTATNQKELLSPAKRKLLDMYLLSGSRGPSGSIAQVPTPILSENAKQHREEPVQRQVGDQNAVTEIPLSVDGKVSGKTPSDHALGAHRLSSGYVCPRTEMEWILTEMWAQALGVDKVGVRDDFFELGGHSLLAVQLFSKIEKAFGRELSLNNLIHSSTVELLARLIDESSEQSIPAHRVVAIQPNGTKPPLFWLPGGNGTSVLAFREISILLGADQPAYGFEAKMPRPGKEFESIQERSGHFIEEMRRVQPHGPYHLLGFCGGGYIAFEMAQQLDELGEEVAFLGIVECPHPHHPRSWVNKVRFRTERLVWHVKRHLGRGARGIVEWAIARLNSFLQALRSRAGIVAARLLREPVPSSPAAPVDPYAAVRRVVNRYFPAKYRGKSFVFIARDTWAFCGLSALTDPRLAWSRLSEGGSTVKAIPGDHMEMLGQPHVSRFADELKVCLQQVIIDYHKVSVRDACPTHAAILDPSPMPKSGNDPNP